ncbi:E3 ubiquitin- ligase UHRF1-like isoform X2, partial [Paramuricea clavata]
MIRVNVPEVKDMSKTPVKDEQETGDNGVASDDDHNNTTESKDNTSDDVKGLYKVGDKVDAKDCDMGAWFEAEIVELSMDRSTEPTTVLYHVVYDGYEEDEVSKLSEKNVRPRASVKLPWNQLFVGQIVMANYNTDEPKERGFWYDVKITRK